MTNQDIAERIKKLRKLIEYHRMLYHTFDAPEISDAAFDTLKNELEELEYKYPQFRNAQSPTQKVGGRPLEEFVKVAHGSQMLSFNDAFSEREVTEWRERLGNYLGIGSGEVEKRGYYCELKIDGLALEFVYKNGKLVQASTRGDGRIGEDVTQNVLTIPTIPHELVTLGERPFPAHLVVRGEIYITKNELIRINRGQERAGLKRYANTRNLAAGSIRQLDSRIAASRAMRSFQYDITSPLAFPISTHEEKHKFLASWGFTINPHNRRVETLKDVFEFRNLWDKKRESLPYEIDGIVVIVNGTEIFERGGAVGKAPRAAIAYKFSPREATTVVEDIRVQVGRTGALTPVAVLRPVEVGGVTIEHATLHNSDEIGRLGVRVGDTVIVSRAGDVIPQIASVVDGLRNGKAKPFRMPSKCPVDGSPVIRDGAIYRCSNPRCGARIREHLYHFVSRAAFDIRGLGPKIIDRFLDEGLISDAADLFELKEGDIEVLERFGGKSARNIIEEIYEKRKITLPRFLFALGILHVGEETARALANAFPAPSIKKLKKVFHDISVERLMEINDIGPKVAESIHGWFNEPKNLLLLEKLDMAGVCLTGEAKKGKTFAGKTFVFTGTLSSFSREEAKERVRALGGEIAETVSKHTDYVVAGENPGLKYERAKKLGIPVLNEANFLKLLKG